MDLVYLYTHPDGNIEARYSESQGFEEKEIPPSKLEEIKTICYTKLQELLKSI